ncbi:MAG: HNH endonuclease [Candidatus Thermofonsia bacterium]|nr:MAG: HNH endonuclease [Candidatus Thermofonsia bacterium]
MSNNGILTQPVLLLNVNFEPLHVCTTKRALMLVLTGKAETIVNGRGYLHTVSESFEIPSVIRLSRMIKRPRPRITLTKREILRRDNYTCQYCGRKSNHLTIDHVIPRHRNGRHAWDNVVAACAPCNRKKGGMDPEEANMKLLRKPFEPSPTAAYRFGRLLESHQEWVQFIEGW